MAKTSQEDFIKLAAQLDTAVDKASSALIKAGVQQHAAQSACVDAISHRLSFLNIQNQETKIAKAAVFALHCENMINMLLGRVFNLAEVSGIANTEDNASKTQTVVISTLIGHAIDGCLVSSESEEDAKLLFHAIVNAVWDTAVDKRKHLDMEEESNAEGSPSIH